MSHPERVKEMDPRGKAQESKKPVCSMKFPKPRPALVPLNPGRLAAIVTLKDKWLNQTNLTYFVPASAPKPWQDVIDWGFEQWRSLGIGLTFQRVAAPSDAIVRVGFDQTDGSWSFVGRDLLTPEIKAEAVTLNIGWDPTTAYGHETVVHEIGHSLGFMHEHQNPKSGIIWDEATVLREFMAPPNSWDEAMIRNNIIDKISIPVEGSNWDPSSVMHYEFGPGLISAPAQYQQGIFPEQLRGEGRFLSDQDIQIVRQLYPDQVVVTDLTPGKSSILNLGPTEQKSFNINVPKSRKYTIKTLGEADTLLVLYEFTNGDWAYLAGDDDSGTDLNASITTYLRKGTKYQVRLRLYASFNDALSIIFY